MIRTLEEVTVMADGLVTYAKDGHEAEDLTQIDLNILLRQICQDRGATFTSQGAASVSESLAISSTTPSAMAKALPSCCRRVPMR